MINEKVRKLSKPTLGHVGVWTSVALQTAEEYLKRGPGNGIFKKYLEPYFLDKAVHAWFFYGVSEYAYDVFEKRIESESKKAVLNLALTLVLGTAKEMYDIWNGSYFDVGDFVSNLFGTSVQIYRQHKAIQMRKLEQNLYQEIPDI